MGSHFNNAPDEGNVAIPSKKDGEVYDFIKLIVKKNLPLTICEDNDYRVTFKHSFKYSTQLIRHTLFNMVPMVEKAISSEMEIS